MQQVNRRQVCRTLAAAAGMAPFSRVLGANDAIRLGVIGIGSTVKIGGKGKQDIRAFRQVPGVRVVALCDVDHANLDPEVQKFKDRNEPVEAYTDFRRVLDNKDVDAIVVTTPNHWHALITILACQAGKDVYCQKPASHNIFEGRKMVEAARKYKRVVAVPHGARERNGIGEALEYIRQGNLGKLLYAHGINYKPRMTIGKVSGPQPIPRTIDFDLWSGPAPVKPLMREYLHYDWHWDWDYGNGDLGNMGIHYMDGCRWAVGQNALPERVLTVAGRFGYKDDGQTPNTLISFLDYKPAPIIFEVRGLPQNRAWRDQNWEAAAPISMDQFLGIQVGLVVHCENGYIARNQGFNNRGRLIKKFEPTRDDLTVNFIKAVRNRKPEDLYSDVLDGHLSAGLVHMINISHRVGKEAPAGEIRDAVAGNKDLRESFERMADHLYANRIDLDKQPLTLGAALRMDPQEERFTGPSADRANALLSREYRKPFVVPDRV